MREWFVSEGIANVRNRTTHEQQQHKQPEEISTFLLLFRYERLCRGFQASGRVHGIPCHRMAFLWWRRRRWRLPRPSHKTSMSRIGAMQPIVEPFQLDHQDRTTRIQRIACMKNNDTGAPSPPLYINSFSRNGPRVLIFSTLFHCFIRFFGGGFKLHHQQQLVHITPFWLDGCWYPTS